MVKMVLKQKILFFSFLLIMLFSIIGVYAADEAAKVGDTFYAGDLATEDYVKLREIITNDKIDFLVNDAGYVFSVSSNNPESLELKLEETESTLTVNMGSEA